MTSMRIFAAVLVSAMTVALSIAAIPGLAQASQNFPTMNDGGGIYWRSAPNWSDPIAKPDTGFYPGTLVNVACYQSGTTVPGSADTMWVQASWVSGPGTGSGWMNEHFVNDGAPINKAAPGIPPCSTGPSGGGQLSGQNLVSTGSSGVCLDANSDHYPNSGDPVQLWGCNNHPEQEWALTSAGQLENTGSPGMCLDANSKDYPRSGDGMQLWACNTHPEQLWALTASGQLDNTGASGMCLDANSNHYPANGDSIQLWACNTHPEQLWHLGTGNETAAEAAAVAWATHQVTADPGLDPGLCLTFVQSAWAGADGGQGLRPWINYTDWSTNTYPQDIWGKFNHGSTGTSQPPPAGALVFFNVNLSQHLISYSHVMISVGNGEMVSTSDTYSEHNGLPSVHYETLAQHAGSGAWNSYIGWWLPDA
jgi:hypothetical protein